MKERDAVDACLTRAFRDVSVPEGLAERLLAGLAVDSRNGGAEIPVCRQERGTFGRQESLPHRTRRRLLVVGGLLAAAAGLMLAVWLGGPREDRVSKNDAITQAIQSFSAESEHTGHVVDDQPAPAGYPLSQQVEPVRGMSWRRLDSFLGRCAVVYDLPGPAGARAALYVVARNDIAGIGTAPAVQHPFTTAGCCASAWQEGGLLYVLVVQGDDPSTYRRFLHLPSSPVA